MPYNQKRIQSLKEERERLELEIAQLESLRNKCHQDINGASDLDKRSQLRAKIKNYSTEINELYDDIDNIEEQINKLSLEQEGSSLNNHLDNPKNQQELNIDKSLGYFDFKKALEIFEKIQSQFDKDGDAVLFFMEESLIKRGDLCLQRLRYNLKLKTNSPYRQNFRYCSVTYTSGNLDAVIQGIGNFFEIQQEKTKINQYIDLVIEKIGKSLQNNSVLFLEINCNIRDEIEIDPLIPWFVKKLWKPLRGKIDELSEDYEGIKAVAVIISDFNLNQRLSEDNLSCYCNNSYDDFIRDKLVKIPLENWTKDDIFVGLKYINPGLKKKERINLARIIYETRGLSSNCTENHAKAEMVAAYSF